MTMTDTSEISLDFQPTTWFLVSYNRILGETGVRSFEDQDEAFAAYIEAEKDPATKGDASTTEVVLIGADSIESVRKAYPHYFATGSRDERQRAAKKQFKRLLTA